MKKPHEHSLFMIPFILSSLMDIIAVFTRGSMTKIFDGLSWGLLIISLLLLAIIALWPDRIKDPLQKHHKILDSVFLVSVGVIVVLYSIDIIHAFI